MTDAHECARSAEVITRDVQDESVNRQSQQSVLYYWLSAPFQTFTELIPATSFLFHFVVFNSVYGF